MPQLTEDQKFSLVCNCNDAAGKILKGRQATSLIQIDGYAAELERFIEGEVGKAARLLLTVAEKEVVLVKTNKGLAGLLPYFVFNGNGLQKVIYGQSPFCVPATTLELVYQFVRGRSEKGIILECRHPADLPAYLAGQIDAIAKAAS
jgi:hypothetical protein